jgi:hypothetical protein
VSVTAKLLKSGLIPQYEELRDNLALGLEELQQGIDESLVLVLWDPEGAALKLLKTKDDILKLRRKKASEPYLAALFLHNCPGDVTFKMFLMHNKEWNEINEYLENNGVDKLTIKRLPLQITNHMDNGWLMKSHSSMPQEEMAKHLTEQVCQDVALVDKFISLGKGDPGRDKLRYTRTLIVQCDRRDTLAVWQGLRRILHDPAAKAYVFLGADVRYMPPVGVITSNEAREMFVEAHSILY